MYEDMFQELIGELGFGEVVSDLIRALDRMAAQDQIGLSKHWQTQANKLRHMLEVPYIKEENCTKEHGTSGG